MKEEQHDPPEHKERLPSVSRLPQEEELRFSAPAPEIEGYQILEKLGEAGQGQVWRAVQSSTGRHVALKVPRIGLLSSKRTLARFEREVEIAAHLRHPHIAPILDSGVHRGLYFYAMDLIEGKHLDQHVQDNALSQRQILELLKIICEAVQHAHQNGVIHRDLKPSNIIVTPEGLPYIVDFGLAKSITELNATVTVSTDGEAAGTPAYMSPEQASGHTDQVDTRTDVYSLGAILFVLLTGRHPHDLSGSQFDVLHRIAQAEVRRPRKLNPKIDRDLESLLLKALERDPDRRYSSAAGLAEDIENYLRGLPLSAMAGSRIHRMHSFVRRHRVGVTVGAGISLLGVAALVMLAAGIIAISREKQRTQEALERELQAHGQETQARQEAVRQRNTARQNLYVAQIRLGQRYWETGQILTLKEVLDAYIPGNSGADLRGWEWYYLLSLCYRDTLTLPDQCPSRQAVTWSPDAKYLAAISSDTKVRIWDHDTGKEILAFGGHNGRVAAVAWSPDGHILATGGDDRIVRLWVPETGQEICTFQGHTADVPLLTWSPCSQYLASAGGDGVVRVWDCATRRALSTFRNPVSVSRVAWCPDGLRIASSDNRGLLRIWEAHTGREIRSWQAQNHDLWAIAWSPDGARLATGGYDHPVVIWQADTGQQVATIEHRMGVESLAWSPDGKEIAAASWGQKVVVWEADTGKEKMSFRGHVGWVRAVVWSPDGRHLASAGNDDTVKIWDARTNPDVTLLGPAAGLSNAIAWSPNGRLLASTHGSIVKIWDGCTGQSLQTLTGHFGNVYSVTWKPDGRQLASSGDDKLIRIWDTTTWQQVQSLQGHTDRVNCVAWCPEDKYLGSAGYDNTVRVWDLSTGDSIQRYAATQPRVVCWSPEGQYAASTASDGSIPVWDTEPGDPAFTLRGHMAGKYIASLAWSGDGRYLASGGWDQMVRVWDMATRRERLSLRGHTGHIAGLAWCPDGSRLVSTGADGAAKIWDTATGGELMTLEARDTKITGIAWSPDGVRVAAVTVDGFVVIWDASRGYGAASASGYRADRARSCYAEARSLAQSGRLREACDMYGRAVELDPNWTAARRERGGVHWQLEEYEAALADLEWCANMEPNRVEYHEQLAEWLIRCPAPRLHDPPRAAGHAEAAIKLSPLSGPLHNILAQIYYRAGQWQKSLDTSQRAMDLYCQPRGPELLLQAMAHWQLGNRRQAFTQYKQAVERLRESQSPASSEVELQREAARLLRVQAAAPDFDWDLKGAEIVGMTATSNCTSSSGADPGNLVSHGGLEDRDDDGLPEHDTDGRHMWRGRLVNDPWIEFDLGGIHAVDAIRIWNFNAHGQTRRGIKTASVQVWTKEGGWTTILENVELDEAPGENHYDAPTVLPLGGANAEKLRLANLKSFGDPRQIGLAKLQIFDVRNHRASRPSPADGSDIGAGPTVDLRWTPALDAVVDRVYLGDDPQHLVLVGESRHGNLAEVPGLERCRWYCWRVDAVRADGSVSEGGLWSFCTGNLVGWWRLDETAGEVVTDSSGRGNHGRLVGDLQWRQDRSGGVLAFDGVDDYVYIGTGADFNITSEITLACRIKVDKFTMPWQPILTKGTYSWRLQRARLGRNIEFACTGMKVEGTTWGNVCGSTTVDDGQWHHIAGVCDGSKLYLYVDGHLDASIDCSGRMNLRAEPVLIAASSHDPVSKPDRKPWCGCIDDVHVYSYALTPQEIQAVYAGNGPPPLLKPAWMGASIKPEPRQSQ